MKIFVVNGPGRAGKDTFEKMVIEEGMPDCKDIVKISSVDYVKDIAQSFGWTGSKEPKDRKMLSDLKDLLTEWNDVPHTKVKERIEHYKKIGVDAVFIDSREPEDIQRFVNEYNALTILVRRNNLQLIYGNHADDNVENYEYDIIIDNSRGLKELQEEAKIFYETFIKGEDE